MKFSIVITTYNRIALLKRAIDSALKQTIPCEVVVADDASSDQTEDYVRSLSSSLIQQGDHRLVYHRNPSNLGHSATMNAGVKAASGDWIKPVDDDDYLALNCIEEMNKAIETYQTKVNQNSSSQAVICSCQASQIDPNGTELSRTRLTALAKFIIFPRKIFTMECYWNKCHLEPLFKLPIPKKHLSNPVAGIRVWILIVMILILGLKFLNLEMQFLLISV